MLLNPASVHVPSSALFRGPHLTTTGQGESWMSRVLWWNVKHGWADLAHASGCCKPFQFYLLLPWNVFTCCYHGMRLLAGLLKRVAAGIPAKAAWIRYTRISLHTPWCPALYGLFVMACLSSFRADRLPLLLCACPCCFYCAFCLTFAARPIPVLLHVPLEHLPGFLLDPKDQHHDVPHASYHCSTFSRSVVLQQHSALQIF